MNRDMMTVSGTAAGGLAGDAAISRHRFIGTCIPCASENRSLFAGTGAGVSGLIHLLEFLKVRV